MAITLWKNKKSPLSIQEMDNNFEELHQRIDMLEKSPYMAPEGIISVTQKDQELFFMGSRGGILGKIAIAQPQWAPRGAWTKKKEYEKYDLVYHEAILYLCHTSHTGEEFFPEEHWTIVYRIEMEKAEKHKKKIKIHHKEGSSLQQKYQPILEKESESSEEEEDDSDSKDEEKKH